MDDVIDYTPYHTSENEAQEKKDRRIGLGTLGLGEMLIRLGVRYGSEEGQQFVDRIYKGIVVEAYKASIDLAEERGAFPAFDYDKFIQSDFMQRLLPELPDEYKDKLKKTGIRNVTILSAAPTGSTGTMIGTSTGIEPYYALSYYRSGRLGKTKIREGILDEYLHENEGASEDNLPDYFVTAHDVTPEEHIKMQASIQKWIDSSISKTTNLPNSATVDDVSNIYKLAYELGIKGTTVFRDGCLDVQVLEEDKPKTEANNSSSARSAYTLRPNLVTGQTEKIKMPKSKLYITTNSVDGNVVEVFLNGTDNGEIDALYNYIGRLISTMLKHGVPLSDIVKQGAKVPGGEPFWYKGDLDDKGRLLKNTPSTISHILGRFLSGEQREKIESKGGKKCPQCKENLRLEEGCMNCHNCGYSKCV